MSEVDRIRRQIKNAFEGEAWHGPALMEVLDGVDAKSATSKPIATAHSIWEIVLHLIATQELILSRVEGESRQLTPEEDWPPVGKASSNAWQAVVERLRVNDEHLRNELDRIDDVRLDIPLVKGGSSTYDNLHGYVQHNLYHAGQIAILRKSVPAGRND